MRGQSVLDPFCGTGACLVAAVRARAKEVIGSDIEDWSKYLRPELRILLACNSPVVRVFWGIDAFEAVKRFEHDTLFTDPPNPWDISSGCWKGVWRDLGLTLYDLRRYWRGKLKPSNLIGKGKKTIAYLIRLVRWELGEGREVVINLFPTHYDRKRWSLPVVFKSLFIIKHIHGNFYQVTALKNGDDFGRELGGDFNRES